MNVKELEDVLRGEHLYPPKSEEELPTIHSIPIITNILCLGLHRFYKEGGLRYQIFLRLCGEGNSTFNSGTFLAKTLALWEKRTKLIKNKIKNADKLEAFFHSAFWGGQQWQDTTCSSSPSSSYPATASNIQTSLPSQNTSTSTASPSPPSSSSSSCTYAASTQTTQDSTHRSSSIAINKKKKYIKKIQKELKYQKKITKCLKIAKNKLLLTKRALSAELRRVKRGKLRPIQKVKISNSAHTVDTSVCRTLYDSNQRTYIPECEECVLSLKDLGVADSKVTGVMEACLKMVNVTYDRLPQKTYVNKVSKKMHVLSSMQVAETAATASESTLYTDETSKYGDKFGAFAITDSNHTPVVLGVRHMLDKSARTTLSTLEEILSDLDDIAGPVSKSIVTKIRSTMSDRASTEKLFNSIFDKFRSAINAEIIPNWQLFSDMEKFQYNHVNHFFCGLHFLTGLADIANEVMRKFEALHFEQSGSKAPVPQFSSGAESGCVRLLRTSCKAFAQGGDDKSGCHVPFAIYCKEHGVDEVALKPFHGNRFNIVFHNGAVLAHMSNTIRQFFLSGNGSANRLLQSVRQDINVPVFVTECQALGLIDKLITGPIWRIMESGVGVMSMKDIYTRLSAYFKETSTETFVSGSSSPFQSFIQIRCDDVFTDLIRDTSSPSLHHVLEQLFEAFGLYTDKIVAEFSNVNDSIPSASALPHNKLPETIFGHLDRLSRTRPSASIFTNEASIMFKINQTSKWLSTKNTPEKKDLLHRSAVKTADQLHKFRQREIDIKRKLVEQQKEKEAKLRARMSEKTKLKEKLTLQIVNEGLWLTVSDMDNHLSSVHDPKLKVEAVKGQLRFRKHVLGQQHPNKQIFNFTINKKTLTWQQLRSNLEILLDNASLSVAADVAAEDEVCSRFEMPRLQGRAILHTFEEDGVLTSYRGRVIASVPGFPEWYNVVYDGELDCIYTYKLVEDWQDGSLAFAD